MGNNVLQNTPLVTSPSRRKWGKNMYKTHRKSQNCTPLQRVFCAIFCNLI